MLEHALRVLELPELLTVVASYADSAPGKARVRAIRPCENRGAAVQVQRLYGDVLRLLEAGCALPRLTLDDITDTLDRLAPAGAVVDGDELVACRRLLDAVRTVSAVRERDDFEIGDSLAACIDLLHPCSELREELHRALEPDGALTDEASTELRRLRRRIRTLESTIQDKLAGFLHRRDMVSVLREDFVTVRNDRFVIPVRREMKNRCSGIVHDHSDSGRTLFVEPENTVPMGNELSDLRLDERDERLRILARLSGRIHAGLVLFRENLDGLAELDRIFAVGRWARDFDCAIPKFGESLALRAARHPLLLHQFRERGQIDAVVPLDLTLERETSVVAITGANSGGKTVAMKTVGLLSVLAAAGMPVPALSESQIEFFHPIFADIGDEQSLAQNLSTFTGHIANIRTVLASLSAATPASDRRALVLLDELGAGTDPLEGGALGCAILEELVECSAFTILTTHLGVLKNVVHESERMVNASVRFNQHTLAPEYALDLGRPGASNAFRIARGLGLPEQILERADALLGSDHLHLESLLSKMEEDQRRIARRERDSKVARDDAERNRDMLRDELETLRGERRRLLQEAHRQAAATVANTRKEMERLIRQLRESADTGGVKETARAFREQLQEKERSLQTGLQQTEDKPDKALDPSKLRAGQRVFVRKLNGDAVISAVRGDRRQVTVEAGQIRVTVSAADLEPPRAPAPPPANSATTTKVSRPRSTGRSPSQLNIIGQRVDEAEPKVESFLDQAALAGLAEVRIIHGIGTGRLQAGVHDILRRHPLVASYSLGQDETDPGGAGTTGVRLAEEKKRSR